MRNHRSALHCWADVGGRLHCAGGQLEGGWGLAGDVVLQLLHAADAAVVAVPLHLALDLQVIHTIKRILSIKYI